MLRLLNQWKGQAFPTVRLLLVNLLVAGLSSACLLLGVEVFYRVKAPYRAFGGASELTQFRYGAPNGLAAFVVDPTFGFRPVLGDGPYTRFGTLANAYAAAKPPGVRRLLFLGDSVTHRGHLVDALRAEYGSQQYEYWNAGVESFNTVQEVAYYRRFNRPLHPDHVILTFHLNDFETTPVAFREADGTLVVFAPNWPLRRVHPWLFQHSYTYRYWLGLVTPKQTARAGIIAEVRASLADLAHMVADDGARLTVVVLPILRPISAWLPEYREYRRLILGILASLGLRYVDLLEPLNAALADGAVVTEPGDTLYWHPSREVAAYFAKYLRTQHVLDDVGATEGQGE
jgi:hypothetical protein